MKKSQIDCAFSSPSGNDIRRRNQPAAPPIMRHALTAIEAPIFLGSPVALMAPFLKIRLSPFRQEHAPRGLECRSRRLEAWLLCRSSPGSDPEAQRCQTPEKAWPDCHRLADHPGGAAASKPAKEGDQNALDQNRRRRDRGEARQGLCRDRAPSLCRRELGHDRVQPVRLHRPRAITSRRCWTPQSPLLRLGFPTVKRRRRSARRRNR